MFKKDKNNKSREELLLEDEMIIVPKSKKAKKQFAKKAAKEKQEEILQEETLVIVETSPLDEKDTLVIPQENAKEVVVETVKEPNEPQQKESQVEPQQEKPQVEPEQEEPQVELMELPINIENIENSKDTFLARSVSQKDTLVPTNTEAFEEKQEKKKELSKKDKKAARKKDNKQQIELQKPINKQKSTELPVKEEKVDINTFFEASKSSNKLKRRDRKKYSKKELKRRKKRLKSPRTSEDIKDQKVFKFRKKKYSNVEDFIKYLNDHYLDIDDVANDVLSDENFFGWISKKSGRFDQSLKEFQEINAKIEKK